MKRDFADLTGQNVLIVEDEYFLAVATAEAVRRASGVVLGPVPDVDGAMAIIADQTVDAAILDVRLGDDLSFPVAKALREKGVQIVFVTGYDDWYLPSEFDEVPIYRKPTDPANVVRILFEPKPDRNED